MKYQQTLHMQSVQTGVAVTETTLEDKLGLLGPQVKRLRSSQQSNPGRMSSVCVRNPGRLGDVQLHRSALRWR